MTLSARTTIEAALDDNHWSTLFYADDSVAVYEHDSGFKFYAAYNENGSLWGIDYVLDGIITHIPRAGALERVLWKIGELNEISG